MKKNPEIIGWRELIALPELGIAAMRAKIDTGARTTALHAWDQTLFDQDGVAMVRFKVPASGKQKWREVTAPVHDKRKIKNTSGIPERRIVIHSLLILGRHRWHIDLSLADRTEMKFDIILGRTAIRRRGIVVDAGKSFLAKPMPS